MKAYLELLERVLVEGEEREDRTGTGTIGLFGAQLHIDISKNFPLLTTKKVHFPAVAHELLWFLKGSTNIAYLRENNVKIWNEWADANGDLGPVYGYQWRHWKTSDGSEIDQIKTLINDLKTNPFSRRHIVSAWNVGELNKMALPPCHAFFQFHVTTSGQLNCQLYQRSADMFLGVPFNIASYSLLTYMTAHVCNLKPGKFVHTFGDAHIYLNHIDQVKLQLSRTPSQLPTLELDSNVKNIDDFKYESLLLKNYNPQNTIKAPISV